MKTAICSILTAKEKKNGSDIYKVKFFLEEADAWRDEVWDMIRIRSDVHFWLLTKRADGENYDGTRPLHYEWVSFLYEQCKKYHVPFSFYGTGNIFVKDGKKYHVCKAYQHVQALRSDLQYPATAGETPLQKRCASCKRKNTCSGCRWCGKCTL